MLRTKNQLNYGISRIRGQFELYDMGLVISISKIRDQFELYIKYWGSNLTKDQGLKLYLNFLSWIESQLLLYSEDGR